VAQVKPRFDGKGSEFGRIHRELGPRFGMFDIDRLSANANFKLELKQQDTGFLEYRTNFETGEIAFKAMFEIKYKDSVIVRDAMNFRQGQAVWAQIKMCEKLDCRYFYVISTNGTKPFQFYEYDVSGRNWLDRGQLEYEPDNEKRAVKDFWQTNLNLVRAAF
jgi:hypothetical protein